MMTGMNATARMKVLQITGGSIEEATVAKVTPVMIIAMAIFAIAFVVIMLTNIPEPHMETAEEKAARLAGKAAKDPYSPLSFRHFVLGAVAIFFYVGIEVGIPNTANVHFSASEVGPALTGTMIGAYWFCMLIGRLIGAPIAGKVSSKTKRQKRQLCNPLIYSNNLPRLLPLTAFQAFCFKVFLSIDSNFPFLLGFM